MKRLSVMFCLSLFAVGCGGGGEGNDTPDAAPQLVACPNSQNPANPGFNCPPAVATAWTYNEGTSAWEEVGPADFSCLGTANEDTLSTVDINITGNLLDFQTSAPIVGASITAFPGVDFATELATATSEAEGAFALTLPTGQTRVGYKVSATNYLDTYTLNTYYEPATADQIEDLNGVSIQTATVVPALLGVTRTPGLGILAGSISDCAGYPVKGAIATVSSTSGSHDHLNGAQTYYFSNGASALPTSYNAAPQTNTNGLFVAIELPEAANAYLQVWGFTADQDPASDSLTLLAEIPAPVLADSVIIAGLQPLRQ